MRKITVLLIHLLVVVSISLPSFAAKERIVVLRVHGKSLSDEDKFVFRAGIVESLKKRFEVLSGDNVDKKVDEIFADESKKEFCDTEKCFQDIAIAFQAELIATSTVSRKSGGYMLTFQINNVLENKSIEAWTEFCKECGAADIISSLKSMARGRTKGGGAVKIGRTKEMDHKPPIISHTPLAYTSDATQLIISAEVRDNNEVGTVVIGFRKSGEKIFIVEEMKNQGTGIYTSNIPESFLQKKFFEYYIEAWDTSGNMELTGKPGTPHQVSIYTVKPYYEGIIVDRNRKKTSWSKKVLTNIGSQNGVKKGDIFTVFVEEDKILDPLTKEVLRIEQNVLGTIKIERVDSRTSEGKVTKESSNNRIVRGSFIRKRPGPTIGLSAESKSIRTVELNWKENQAPETAGYIIYRSKSPDGPFDEIKKTQKRETDFYTDKNESKLEDNTRYYYKVAAYNKQGLLSIPTNVAEVLSKAGPTPPISFSSSNSETKQISFKWDKAEDPDTRGFIIEMADSKEGDFKEVLNIKGKDKKNAKLKSDRKISLTDGKAYYFQIIAYNKFKTKGTPSETVKGFTQSITPPQGLELVKEGVRLITVKWDVHSDENIKEYYIYRSDTQDGKKDKVGKTTGRNKTVFTESGGKSSKLVDDKKYFFTVTAVTKKGIESPHSEFLIATTSAEPKNPAGINAQSNLVRKVKLTWDAMKSDEVSGYIIYKSEDGNSYKKLKKINGKEKKEFTDSNKLQNGTKYYYLVASYNLVDVESKDNQPVEATTKYLPVIPAGLSGTSGEVKQSIISWSRNPETDIAEYEIWRSTKEKDGFKVIEKTNSDITAYKDNGLKDGSIYYYYVIAVDADKLMSNPSDLTSITTKPLPELPSEVTATSTQTEVELSWNESLTEDVVKYNVYMKSVFSKELVGTTDKTTFTVKDLKPNKTFSYNIAAVDVAGLESKFTESVTIKTKKQNE